MFGRLSRHGRRWLSSASFEPRNPDWEGSVRATFRAQPFMSLIGARLSHASPGAVDIVLRGSDEVRGTLLQHHGFYHAGVTMTIGDVAAGLAAQTLYPPGTSVLTTELKVNLLAPARPDAGEMVARGRVVRPGRTLTVCRSDVCIGSDAVATFLMTMFAMPHEP